MNTHRYACGHKPILVVNRAFPLPKSKEEMTKEEQIEAAYEQKKEIEHAAEIENQDLDY